MSEKERTPGQGISIPQRETARFLNPEDLSGHSFSDCCLTGFGTPWRLPTSAGSFSFHTPLFELIDDKMRKVMVFIGINSRNWKKYGKKMQKMNKMIKYRVR